MDGGNGYGNRKTIGIEICYSKSGGQRFRDAERLAARFIAQLLQERGWSIDRVHKHQDYSGKYCPHRTLDIGWQSFLDMVSGDLNPKTVKIDWRDVEAKTGKIKGTTNLVDVASGKVIKAISGTFTYVQQTADGRYVRTDYSRDNNINNGILYSALEFPEPEPVAPKITWKDVGRVDAVVQGSTNLINLDTGATVARVSGDFTYVQVTSDNKWARTDYSRDHNVNNGVALDRLTTKLPEQPYEDKKPEGEVESGVDEQIENLINGAPTEDKGWLRKLIDAVVGLFKKG